MLPSTKLTYIVAMMFDIHTILPRISPIEILDVGAMATGAKEPYAKLIAAASCRITGFEPQQAECDKLNAAARSGYRYFPHALGDGARRNFYICKFAASSSLYEPNTPLLSLFTALAELNAVERVEEIQTRRLDDIAEITDADYIKLDVQGAELDVLAAGKRILSQAVLVHTEVEFVEMYKGQPLFGEIDSFLRKEGFAFHTFMGFAGRTFIPVTISNNPYAPLNQALWTEAVYVKNFLTLEKLPTEKLLKLAVILHAQYGSFDLAHRCLAVADSQRSTNYAASYLARLTGTALPAK
jgi:FkbM family methyltransferase